MQVSSSRRKDNFNGSTAVASFSCVPISPGSLDASSTSIPFCQLCSGLIKLLIISLSGVPCHNVRKLTKMSGSIEESLPIGYPKLHRFRGCRVKNVPYNFRHSNALSDIGCKHPPDQVLRLSVDIWRHNESSNRYLLQRGGDSHHRQKVTLLLIKRRE